MRKIELFKEYENAKINSVEEYKALHADTTYRFGELGKHEVNGVPICSVRNKQGELEVTFIPDTHLLAIGATRSGKTTGFAIPALNILARKKNKPSIAISDPKQELYRQNAGMLEKLGYRIILLDFNNYRNSDCWNPLTKYYRTYQKYLHVEDEVEAVNTPEGPRNRFRGVIYDSMEELELDIREVKEGYFDEVEKGITALSYAVIQGKNEKDPFWDDSSRDLFCAIIYGMLEDSEGKGITEDNFSFDSLLKIFDSFGGEAFYDRGYFTRRDETSRALSLAKKCIIEQANNTRHCISSNFASKINIFRDTAIRRVTCANTFEIEELDDGAPVAIFVSYKDEEALHYDIISMFLSNLYTGLIAVARDKSGSLDRPFYFLLDEFGNLPKFNDFDKVISACGGRNIWFLLILQSYAQLYNIYGKETAEIIKDNLNTHIFFGTNNPQTKIEFSEECGKKTIISPISALNGDGEAIERFDKDTVSLVPVSALTHIQAGECIVTQMKEDVLWSRIERSYTCPEFDCGKSDARYRPPQIRFSDPKYSFTPRKPARKG